MPQMHISYDMQPGKDDEAAQSAPCASNTVRYSPDRTLAAAHGRTQNSTTCLLVAEVGPAYILASMDPLQSVCATACTRASGRALQSEHVLLGATACTCAAGQALQPAHVLLGKRYSLRMCISASARSACIETRVCYESCFHPC
jgi:hypothetical protein